MKKTLTVNLGGTVFHIDEDAYQLLDKYLTNLRLHFNKEEGSDEIMNDFEMRISELFNERIRLGYEVITIEHVEVVIKRMGKPEDLFENENIQEENKNQNTSNKENEGKKRLMRDPDNKLLGGVAGGIAAYMGWDTTAVRLAMILLLFVPYAPIVIIYIILWLIMPLARTAADKLIMRGESVTLENIGKTVTDGFEKVSNNVNDYISSDKPRTCFQKFADLFVNVVGYISRYTFTSSAITCSFYISHCNFCPLNRRNKYTLSPVSIWCRLFSRRSYIFSHHGMYRYPFINRYSYILNHIRYLYSTI